MKIYGHSVMGALCRATGKPGLFVVVPDWGEWWKVPRDEWLEHVMMAIPWLASQMKDELRVVGDPAEAWQALGDGCLYVICDSEEERDRLFDQVKGDDPNDVNTYSGPARAYALTFDSDGEAVNENT